MKTRHPSLYAFLLAALAAAPAGAARDPFWPIGYEPPKPKPVAAPNAEPAADVSEASPQPAKPAEQPITEADWALARKALVISGYTRSVRPDTQETRTLAMINRLMVGAGDTVTFVHKDVRFFWRAEAVTGHSVQLAPLKAERVSRAPADPALRQ
jgi:hypothetical protein